MIYLGTLEGVPKRVISLNPSVNEFLALLGVELAGRDVYSIRPRELLAVPKVGTFISIDTAALEKIGPDLAVLYYPVQKNLLDAVSKYSKAVVAIPTPANIDQIVSIFRYIARLFNKDEEGDRVAGIYRDLLRGSVIYENVLAVIKFDVYEVACSNVYVADVLTAVGLKYRRGLPCFFITRREPPVDLIERADFVVYESSGLAYSEREVAFINKSHVVTPGDTIAHYGPSLPLDVQKVAEAAARGERWVGGVSRLLTPSLRDSWYRPYR
ncbi:MAG: ABC transporter substrate-binding protein [Pyrobaculum sp.]